MFPRVSIIILNWNGWMDTIECLESLYRITYPNYDVIVIDNGSNDDSVKKIKEYADGKIVVNSKFFKYNPNNKPIKVFEISEDDARQGKFNRPLYEKIDVDRRMILIKNEANYGFAGGNNVGIKFALSILNPDYVLLLNNDTVVDPKFLSELVKIAENNEKIGIIGPKIYYYDYNKQNDIIWFAGGRIFWWFPLHYHKGIRSYDNVAYSRILEVDFITGACVLIRKEILCRLGLLPTEYFMQYEDIDFSMRVIKYGYKSVYVPMAKIWHKVSASYVGLKCFHIKNSFRGSILFYRKYLSLFKFSIILILLIFIKLPIFLSHYVVRSRNISLFKCGMEGIIQGLLDSSNLR